MKTIKNVSISKLHSFRNYPFKVETNTKLCELMRSIKKEGVLVPLLVRTNTYGDGYEVISGHRRKEAALWAGETEVPAVVRELDDDQAVVAMVDSNLYRENLKPSEKAFAYRMKLEAMKHQGKKVLVDDITLAQVEPRSAKKEPGDVFYGAMRSNELLAKQAGESVAHIKRYIRLTNLIPKMLNMVNEGKVAFTVAVEISYLKEEEQYEFHVIMDLEPVYPIIISGVSFEGNEPTRNIGYGCNLYGFGGRKAESAGADKASYRCIGKVFLEGLYTKAEDGFNRTASEGVV